MDGYTYLSYSCFNHRRHAESKSACAEFNGQTSSSVNEAGCDGFMLADGAAKLSDELCKMGRIPVADKTYISPKGWE